MAVLDAGERDELSDDDWTDIEGDASDTDERDDARARERNGKYGDEGVGVSRAAGKLSDAATDEESHRAAAEAQAGAGARHRDLSARRAMAGDYTKSGEHLRRAIEHDGKAGEHSRAALDARADGPDQPRDEQGRFGDGGESSSSTPKAETPRAVPAAEFKGAFDTAFKDSAHAAFVTHYSADELAGMQTFLSHDGKVGVAVHDQGDGRIEATALFNAGGPPGAGSDMLRHAIDDAGVNYVECYAPHLNALYECLGFKETSRASFEPKYAPTWDASKFGTPDYVTMRR